MFELKSRQAWCRSLWLKDVGLGVQLQRFAGSRGCREISGLGVHGLIRV